MQDTFGTEKISSLLLKLVPPVMPVQLIQALYNIVDSYYIENFQNPVFIKVFNSDN